MTQLGSLVSSLSMIGLCMLLFLVAKMAKDLFTSYSIDRQLVKHDNLAVAISVAGYFFSVLIVLLGALIGPSEGLQADIVNVGAYGLFGIVLLNISRWVNDKLILARFSTRKEIVDDKNAGTGAVECASYIASGLVVAGAIHGEGGGILTAVVFFGVAQIALIAFAKLYALLLPFDIHDEIEKDNVAAGVSFGGTLIALGVILLNGTAGDFVGWVHNLAKFGVNAAAGFLLLPLIRFALDKIIIPRADLNREIKNDRNVGLGLIEMCVAVSFAVVLYFTLSFEPVLALVLGE